MWNRGESQEGEFTPVDKTKRSGARFDMPVWLKYVLCTGKYQEELIKCMSCQQATKKEKTQLHNINKIIIAKA